MDVRFFEHIDWFDLGELPRAIAAKNLVKAQLDAHLLAMKAQAGPWDEEDPFRRACSLVGFSRFGRDDRTIFDEFWDELNAMAPSNEDAFFAAGKALAARFPVLLGECVPNGLVIRHSEDAGYQARYLFRAAYYSQRAANPLGLGMWQRYGDEEHIEAFFRGVRAFDDDAQPYAGYHFNSRVGVKERFCRLAIATKKSLRPGLAAVFNTIVDAKDPFAVLEGQNVPLQQMIEAGAGFSASPHHEHLQMIGPQLAKTKNPTELKDMNRVVALAMKQEDEWAAIVLLAYAVHGRKEAAAMAKWLETPAWSKLPEDVRQAWSNAYELDFDAEDARERLLALDRLIRLPLRHPLRAKILDDLSWHPTAKEIEELIPPEIEEPFDIEPPPQPSNPLYDEPPLPKPTLFPFLENNQWGYMDAAGVTKIRAQFDKALPFGDGLGVVCDGEAWLAIDAGGKTTALKHAVQSGFMRGFAAIGGESGTYGLIDTRGELVVPAKYRAPPLVSFGRIVASTYDSVDVYDFEGKVVFTAKALDAFRQGVAFGTIGEQTGFFDVDGRLVIDKAIAYCKGFHQGRAVLDNGARQGVIDYTTSWIVPFREGQKIEPYFEGRAAVWKDGKWGFFDLDGKMAISPRYSGVGSFSEGLCMAVDARGMHYIDPNGEIVLENVPYGHGPFVGGLAHFVQFNERQRTEGYINRHGDLVKMWTTRHTMIRRGRPLGDVISPTEAHEEFVSIASFARLTLDLMALGAPLDLIERSQRASLDEVRHARQKGAPERFPPLPETRAPFAALTLDSLAAACLRDGCLNEGIAATLESDGTIAQEERGHARLSWDIVAWAITQGASRDRLLLLLRDEEFPSEAARPVEAALRRGARDA